MALFHHRPVTLSELLEYLMTRTQAPSTMGSQLARMQLGIPMASAYAPPDAEVDRIAQRLPAIRAADRISRTPHGRAALAILRVYTPHSGIRGTVAVAKWAELPDTPEGQARADQLVTDALQYVGAQL